MTDLSLLRDSLIKQAETVLQPSLAILIECAFEAEANTKAAEFLEGIINRFNECAKKGVPLSDGGYEVFDFFALAPTGDHDVFTVGLLSDATLAAEATEQTDISTGSNGFIKYIVERALKLELSKLAPAVFGVGIAETARGAQVLSRIALFRTPTNHSPDKKTAECERRILAMINNKGPGAGGFGGGHTALAVSIEHTGEGFAAICPGDYFTRFAFGKL